MYNVTGTLHPAALPLHYMHFCFLLFDVMRRTCSVTCPLLLAGAAAETQRKQVAHFSRSNKCSAAKNIISKFSVKHSTTGKMHSLCLYIYMCIICI